MNANVVELLPSADHAFRPALTLSQLRAQAPAAFAERPFAAVGLNYRFISTRELVEALLEAGFIATDARQARARGERAGYARHLLRFRPLRTTVRLDEAIAEIALVNAHDGTSAYQVRAGLFRPVCTNGLLAKLGDFGAIYVPHRGNVVANIVDAAQRILAGFQPLAARVREMVATPMVQSAQQDFAQQACALRWDALRRVEAEALLERRRPGDAGDDLWTVYNVIQENLLRGGLRLQSAGGRASRTRAVRAIREDVRINTGLWQAAIERIRVG